MKRLFGTIGLTYLTVLAVAFFLSETTLYLLAAGFLLLGGGIAAVIKNCKNGKTVLLAGASMALATISIFLFRNYIYQPVIDKYSDTEISFKGYICDKVIIAGKTYTVELQAEEINGEKSSIKIHLTGTGDFEPEDFDRVEGKLFVYANKNENLISKGFFLSASPDDGYELKATGEKHFSLYNLAVKARDKCNTALTRLLNRKSGALCKAILLGDKYGLSKETKHDFQRAGTSFLIVVSGMHLSILCGFLVLILKRTRLPRLLRCSIIVAFVIMFSAITGFPRSVIRAGVMVILAYCGNVLRRQKDGLNSIGIAALILALPNPFVVGDLGVLMTFSTTLGIILWAPHLIRFMQRVIHFNSIKLRLVRKPVDLIINLIAVSVSAALWVMPVQTLFLNRINLLVIPLSVITSPIASVILILSLILILLYYIPFISVLTKPLSAVMNFLCGLHIDINSLGAAIPFSSVKANQPFYLIWLFSTCALVAAGYIISAGKKYIVFSIITSAAILGFGWSVHILTDTHPTEVYLNQSFHGLTAAVSKNGSLSVLCCGGNGTYNDIILDDLYGYSGVIDNAVIPNRINYSSYLTMLREHFDLKYIVANQKFAEEIPEDADLEMPSGSKITLVLNSDTSDEVMNIDGILYQYLTVGDTTLLFVPHYGDIEKLPAQYRTADYIVMDFVSYHAELLNCKTLIYTGRQNKRYAKYRELLGSISDNFIPLKKQSICLKMNEGR